MTAQRLLQQMRKQASPQRAVVLRRFFKTGPGEYGEGDRFLGLTVPQVRALTRAFRGIPLGEIEILLESPWHEARLAAVILLGTAYATADPAARMQVYDLYLRRSDRINNWDLVDASAPQVVGVHLVDRSRAPLRRLARSASVWERRIAIIATLTFIRRGELDDTLQLALLLSDDEHDLIHKAVGWMLREVGKRDEPALLAFLDRHAAAMPRTTLRYAIERLPSAHAKRYMAVRRAAR
jgi:3-methyladenine DNA glycosylase AlkD